MVYNNVTNNLQRWCNEMTLRYYDIYQKECAKNRQSLHFVSYRTTAEISYKLCTLIDKEFPSFEEYKKAVYALLSIHIDDILKKELKDIENDYVQTTESLFVEYLESALSDCIPVKMPYRRVIWGDEADCIIDRFYEVWKYNTTYWYPLNEMSGDDKLFMRFERVRPYLGEINRILGLPQERIYEYGEACYNRPHCAEVDELEEYSGSEVAYCPKDFSWLIYYSHEDTVTFAGDIVSLVKGILGKECEYWNCFD